MRSLLAVAALVGAGACVTLARAQVQPPCDDNTSLPAARFTDNGDGTVTDADSKLMWMRCAIGQQWRQQRCIGAAAAHAWSDALQHAREVSRDGAAFFSDWRVPTLRELATITDRGCRSPRTNVSVFPDTPAAPFWSATPRAGEAAGERAMALSFGGEGVVLARTHERMHVRLVRTGP